MADTWENVVAFHKAKGGLVDSTQGQGPGDPGSIHD